MRTNSSKRLVEKYGCDDDDDDDEVAKKNQSCLLLLLLLFVCLLRIVWERFGRRKIRTLVVVLLLYDFSLARSPTIHETKQSSSRERCKGEVCGTEGSVLVERDAFKRFCSV